MNVTINRNRNKNDTEQIFLVMEGVSTLHLKNVGSKDPTPQGMGRIYE